MHHENETACLPATLSALDLFNCIATNESSQGSNLLLNISSYRPLARGFYLLFATASIKSISYTCILHMEKNLDYSFPI